jgi:hypothetical protein
VNSKEWSTPYVASWINASIPEFPIEMNPATVMTVANANTSAVLAIVCASVLIAVVSMLAKEFRLRWG